MNNKEFADKALYIAKNTKSAYLLGAFGFQATDNNLRRLLNQYPENYNWIEKAQDIIGQGYYWDCVGLLKGIAWGWNNDDAVYGGAAYGSNGVSDINANQMCSIGKDVSTDFSNIMVGEAVWMNSHIGIYCGNNIVVEATPSFANGVQTTALLNKGAVSGLYGRYWTKHFKLPWVDYTYTSNTSAQTQQVNYKQAVPARYFSEGYADQYRVTPNIGVNIRTQPSIKGAIIKAIPHGSIVNNYGYFGVDENNEVWLYIKYGNIIGYIKKEFLS